MVVVVASERSYVGGELADAASRLGIDLAFVTDRCHVLDEVWPSETIAVEFRDPEAAAQSAATALSGREVTATLGTDEPTAIVAEVLGRALGVPSSAAGAAARAADKFATREALTHARLAQPRFMLHQFGNPLPDVTFPAIVKPRCLSASRGVCRVDGRDSLVSVLSRLERVLGDVDLKGRYGDLCQSVLIEEFIAGPEVALDGVLVGGVLSSIAMFDKPRPLDGPYFAESLYVLPSAISDTRRLEAERATALAAQALGLREGPIHAELRLSADGPVVIEIAARSIGGLCGRTLRLASGRSIAEVVLATLCSIKLGMEDIKPAGVAMLAPPRSGVFFEMRGVGSALAVEGIVEVSITAHPGQRVAVVPDGSDYLGFVFAEGASRANVIASLAAAEARLDADVRPLL